VLQNVVWPQSIYCDSDFLAVGGQVGDSGQLAHWSFFSTVEFDSRRSVWGHDHYFLPASLYMYPELWPLNGAEVCQCRSVDDVFSRPFLAARPMTNLPIIWSSVLFHVVESLEHCEEWREIDVLLAVVDVQAIHLLP
jgi:hypothetical protein